MLELIYTRELPLPTTCPLTVGASYGSQTFYIKLSLNSNCSVAQNCQAFSTKDTQHSLNIFAMSRALAWTDEITGEEKVSGCGLELLLAWRVNSALVFSLWTTS